METSGAAEPLLGGRRGPGCAQTSVPGLDRILSGRRSSAGRADASRQYVPLHTPDASKLQGRSRAHGNATGTPDRMRMAHRDWKLAERHHRHKLSLAYLGESEMSGPPFSVRYRQLSRRELTLEVLLSSYPAGRAALYADADGVPLPEPQLPSSTPLSPTLQPSPPRGSMPSTPALGAQAGQPSAPGHMSRLPSGLLLSRRVEQLVGGFIRTRDVRAIDPVFSRELADLGMLGSGMNGSASPQPSSPAQSLILVRCGAIIIRLFHLRAIVVHDGVYIVLDPRAPETSDADAVRAVALRLKASTQEDRLGPADEVAIRDGIRDPRDRSLCGRDVSADQSLAGQDLSERGDCSSRGRDDAQPPSPTLSERLGGSGLLVPTLPSREPSCVSDLSHQSNETDVEMPAAPSGAGARERAAAGPHAGSAAPVLIGCSRIGEASSAAELALSGGSGGGNGGGGDDGGCAGAADWRGMRPSGALSVSSSQPRQGAGATPRGAAGTAPGRGGGVGGGSASAGGAPAIEEAPGEAQRGAPRADGQPAQPQPQDSGGGVEESAAAQSLPPFPLRALESIFDVVVDDLKARLTALKDETRTALHALRLAVADTFGGIDDSVSFEIVRSLRERVRALTVSVRGAARAVAEVLDDDVQMAFIYLKKVHFAPECYEQVRRSAARRAVAASRARWEERLLGVWRCGGGCAALHRAALLSRPPHPPRRAPRLATTSSVCAGRARARTPTSARSTRRSSCSSSRT